MSASASTSTQSSNRPSAQVAPAEEEDPSLQDAEGDLDEEFEQLLPTSSTKTNGASRSSASAVKADVKPVTMPSFGKIKKGVEEKEEGEASEGEIVEEKPRPISRVPPPGRAKQAPVVLRTPAKPAAVTKLPAKSRAPQPSSNLNSKPVPPAPKQPLSVPAVSSAVNGSSNKRALEPDEEEFDLSPPTKRARTPPASSSKGSGGLALPGAPLSLPSSAPVGLSFPGMSDATVSLPPPALAPVPATTSAIAAAAAADSDEEDEWDEVQPPPASVPMPMLPPGRMIHMEEIDPAPTRPSRPAFYEPEDNDNAEDEDAWDDFEAEMERVGSADPDPDPDHYHDADVDGAGGEEEEDFLSAAIQEHPQYDAGDSDDDDTSSDDSDDD